MVERRDGCLPTATVGFAPADDIAVGRDAHQQRIDRGARAPCKQRRRRPMVHGDAERNGLDPFDGDRSHVAVTRPSFGRLYEMNSACDTAMQEAETAAAPRHSEVFILR